METPCHSIDGLPLVKKVNFLKLMLGQIANYCPIISPNTLTLVKNSTSLAFINFSDIHLAADECPEDLYQSLVAFVEDSSLRSNGLTHHMTSMFQKMINKLLPYKTLSFLLAGDSFTPVFLVLSSSATARS